MGDIARVAGCSQSTVSFVLNANKSVQISQETRNRVLQVAKELGYKPPTLSGYQDRRRPFLDGTIAVVIDSISTSPEGIVALDGIRQAVKATGNIVLVAETSNDPVLEPKTLSMFIEQQVAAIIYTCIFTRKVVLPDELKSADLPVFLLNCYSDDMMFPSVVPSEIAGGHRATNSLIDAGHHRIGTITGELFMEAAEDRLAGYRNALATADIPFAPELVVKGDWSASAGYRGAREMMALPVPPTAIFCQNDRTAIGCYEALKELGLSIPHEVSVIGYDDEEIARHLSPPLTSLVLPHRAMGRWVIEQLFHATSLATGCHPLTKLECLLVERDSIAAPKR
jgi:LacI family transcriptional regulator